MMRKGLASEWDGTSAMKDRVNAGEHRDPRETVSVEAMRTQLGVEVKESARQKG